MMNQRTLTPSLAAAGAGATVATTAVLTLIGQRQDLSPWAPINAVSHIVWGDEAGNHVAPSLKYTATGAVLNAAAVTAWALPFAWLRKALPVNPVASAAVAGIATAALAYVVDYHVVPRRLTPGFELRLPKRSFLPIYASLAVGLAAGALLADQGRR